VKYPRGFPVELQRGVEVARDKAEIALRLALRDDEAHRLNEAFKFVVDVFRVFTQKACQAEQQGVWQGAQGRDAVERFLGYELIPHAYVLARIGTFVLGLHPPPKFGPVSAEG